MPKYLFEFHFRDGRISAPVPYEWDDTSAPLDEGLPVELEFEGRVAWRVVRKLPAERYAHRVVLEERDE